MGRKESDQTKIIFLPYQMTDRGIEILRQEKRLLTEDEVRTLYSHLQDEVIVWVDRFFISSFREST